jgi:hypothetical protein
VIGDRATGIWFIQSVPRYRGTTDKGKGAVRAARRDERQAKAAPLLAASGLLEACTPDELMNAARKQAEDWDRTDRKFVRFARLARYLVWRRVTPEELCVMDRRRAKLPKSPAYRSGFLAPDTRKSVWPRPNVSEPLSR